jgi:hypothetical protein
MKTFSIKAFIDALFFSGVICFASFILFNYFLDRPYAVILSSTLFSLSLIFFFMVFNKKSNVFFINSKQKYEIDNLAFSLMLFNTKKIISLLASALSKKNQEHKVLSKAVYITQKKLLVYPKFSPDGVSKADIVYAYNLLNNDDTAVILCDQVKNEILPFLARFGKRIKISKTEKFYELLKETDLLPDNNQKLFAKKRPSVKNVLFKKHAKNYIVFGVVFYFLSLIIA